jgi:uridylate kinase
MPLIAFHRVVLKLSGEALAGEDRMGLDFVRARHLAQELGELRLLGTQMALVIGGGNICRGREAAEQGVIQAEADRMGMLATILNAMTLAAMFEAEGVPARVLSAVPVPGVVEGWTRERALATLAAGEFVIAAGGIGQPFFSTDTTAALRAVELGAELLLKGTQVDGVYTADPRKDPTAERLPRLSYDEVLARKLQIMDATAFALCRDYAVPIRIFNFSEPGALKRILLGENLGSQVVREEDQDDR